MDMMQLQILFFACIPVGLFLAVFGGMRVYKVFHTETLAQIRMSEEQMDFELAAAGHYAIWAKTPVLQANPLNRLKPEIYDRDNREKIDLKYSWLGSPRANNGMIGVVELFIFDAQAGRYEMKLVPGSSSRRMLYSDRAVSPFRGADPACCFFQVRKRIPDSYFWIGLILFATGTGAALSCLVFGLFAGSIWG